MPVNAVDHHWTSFQRAVLPEAMKRNIGVIGMKSLGSPGQFVNKAKILTARECLHYAMNMPVSTVVSGIDSMEKLRKRGDRQELQAAQREEVAAILAAAPSRKGASSNRTSARRWP